MKRSVKVDLSWRAWSLIVGFFILVGFVGLGYAISPSIHGHPDQTVMPSGAIMAFYLTSCPSGWIVANGSGGTPDLRGTFVRGMLGEENGRDVARELGNYQLDEFKNHTHGLSTYGDGSSSNRVKRGDNNFYGSTSTQSAGGTETRPKNVALLYCMKV